MQIFYASVAFAFFTVLYDEWGCHARHWAIRDFVNACGFAAFEYGSILIARASPLDPSSRPAVFILT